MAKRLLVAFLLLPFITWAYTSPVSPRGFVNDFAGILKPETVSSLESSLTQFEQETGAEISVVTVPTAGGDETIETYAVKLFEEWGIGKADLDNGLLLLIARDDREMRIEVGYGLEGSITDLESSFIIRDILTPSFRQGDFDGGVTQAVARIMAGIRAGEPLPIPDRSPAIPDISAFFYPAIFVLIIMGSILGRSKSWWLGGVFGAIVGIGLGIFLGFLYSGIVAILILTPLGLLFDYIVSKAHQKHRDGGPQPPWFMGGGGFGGGGGGGFGGFGGGMSGGGGSSGRW